MASCLDSLEDEPDIERDPNYVLTAEAAKMLGCDHKKLWQLVRKGRLSKPERISQRRCFWLRSEIVALGGKSLPPSDDFTVSREEVASLLGVCRETVSRMVADFRLPRGKMKSGRLYFREKDIEEALAQQSNDEKLPLSEASVLVGIPSSEIMELVWRGCFPSCFRRGEVVDWLEKYRRTGSPCGDPERDRRFFKHLVKSPCNPKKQT